jgi:hypothetical protein
VIERNFTIESRSFQGKLVTRRAERDRVRPDLLDYCHRDAPAMIKLVETLEGLAIGSVMRPTRPMDDSFSIAQCLASFRAIATQAGNMDS